MDNLRKRVGELQLDKNWKPSPLREVEKEKEGGNEEEKPLLKVTNLKLKKSLKFYDECPRLEYIKRLHDKNNEAVPRLIVKGRPLYHENLFYRMQHPLTRNVIIKRLVAKKKFSL